MLLFIVVSDLVYMESAESYLQEFDEQFSEKGSIALDIGSQAIAGVIDVDPLIVQPQKDADIPILVAPGFLVSPERLKAPVREFWLADRRVIAVQHPRHIVRRLETDLISEATDIAAAKLNRIELGRAATLLKVINEKDVNRVDVVGISEGGINATFLALLRPERVRSLILINSAGIGGESFSYLVNFFMARTIKELTETALNPKPKVARARAPLLHYASNPLSRLRSLRAMSQCRIDTLFETIENSGVAVGILKSSTDAIYPEEVERHFIDTNVISSYKVLDHPKSGHSPLYSLPKQTVELILNMQQSMLA